MKIPTAHPFLLALLREGPRGSLTPPSPHDPSWETILAEAEEQGLLFLLSDWARASDGGGRLPADAAKRMKARLVGMTARNAVLVRELATILDVLASKRVPCAPIRGAALAELLYGDPTRRPMGDIDLLMRKEDLPAAGDIMKSLGFQEMDRRPGFARTYSYTLKFIKDRHGWVIVEPHWTLAYPPFTDRIDMDAVWERCVRGRVLGMETWLLSREDLVLHLCLHLIHRGESAPLLWLYELDRLIRQADRALDWSLIVHTAKEAGQALFLSEVLCGVRSLLETPIPEKGFSQVGGLADDRVVRLLAGDSQTDGRESLALFFAIKGLRAKLRYAWALLFPSREFMRLHYGLPTGRRLAWPYLNRLLYLTGEGIKGLARLAVILL